jgi:hypothetical protein
MSIMGTESSPRSDRLEIVATVAEETVRLYEVTQHHELSEHESLGQGATPADQYANTVSDFEKSQNTFKENASSFGTQIAVLGDELNKLEKYARAQEVRPSDKFHRLEAVADAARNVVRQYPENQKGDGDHKPSDNLFEWITELKIALHELKKAKDAETGFPPA